ncbi:RrF2 family transcriptional regulator [Congregicoccus parvus]|uniref:RrF2 family transcriptional regulator n=1 Tax=Congregicoccus parvus TaxID=3081749 RepID=UPI003FA5AE77
MKLSVKVEYGCRVLAQLARLYGSGELAHIEQLAKTEAVPANYLVQILSELRTGGLIVSRRGKQGGYALARAPESISLYEVVTLIDGAFLEIGASVGGYSGRRVHQVWQGLRKTLEDSARSITLDMLVVRSAEEMYYI